MQDPIKRKQLYSYLKENDLTDLSYDKFSSEYSGNKQKFKELFSYLKSEDMTDLDQDTFYKEYFGDVKKKDVGGVSPSKNQKENFVSVGEVPVNKPKPQNTQQTKIPQEQYNPNLPDDLQTLEPNPDFNENQPESVFNPKYNKTEQKYKYTSVLDNATDEELKALNDFENITVTDEELNKDLDGDNSLLGKAKRLFNTAKNYSSGLNPLKSVSERVVDDVESRIIDKDARKQELLKKKQIDFIKNLSGNNDGIIDKAKDVVGLKEKPSANIDQERLLTLVKAKQFEKDVNLKVLKTEISELDNVLYEKTEHINSYKEQFDLLEKEKERLKAIAEQTDDIKPLIDKFNSVVEEQKKLLKEQEEILKETNKLYDVRLNKAVTVENYTNNIGLFEQEVDLLKRNWGTIDNISKRLMLGTTETVDAFSYELKKELYQTERSKLKELIKTGDLTDEEVRKQIPPKYLIGKFDENEFDADTKKENEVLLRGVESRQNEYERIRESIAPEIETVQSKQDFVDYTLYNLSNAAGILAQFAIPVVGEASAVISTKLHDEIEHRITNLEIEDKIKLIDEELSSADEQKKVELINKRKELESEKLSELQIQTASSLSGLSFVALSRLGGYTKQLAKGKRILTDMTKSELQPYLKTSYKRAAKGLYEKGVKAAKEVLEETAEGAATMGAGLTMTNNLIDHFIVGKKDVGIFDGVDESMYSMANLSGVLAIAPRVAGIAVSHLTSNNRRAKVYTNTKKIAEHKKTLATEDLSKDTQNLIIEKIKRLNDENKKLVKSSITGFDNLELEDRAMLLNLSDRAKQLEISLAEINRRNNPTNVELELKAELEKELLDIDKDKDYIIGKEITVKKDGETKQLNKKQFEEFLQDDENIRLIKQGKAEVNIKNYEELPKQLEQRIKDLSAPKEAVEFAKALSEKAEVNPETESVVVDGKTKITSKDNKVEIKGDIDVDKAVNIADEKGFELKVEKPKDETKKKEYEEKGFVEQEDSMIRKPEKETIEIPKDDIRDGITIETDKDTYTVKVDNGNVLIEPKYAGKVTEGERKKVIDKFVKETNFDNGKQVDFEGVNPGELNRVVAEKSENPYEVALALKHERDTKVDKSDEGNITKEQAIALELKSGVDYEDFRKQGGDITESKVWFKKDPNYRHHSIESVVERLQEKYPHLDKNEPFNVSDVVDFIDRTSREEYNNILNEKLKTQTEIELEQKFEQLTGLKADEKTIDNVLKLDEKTEVETDFTIDAEGEIPFQTQSKFGHIAGKVLKGLVDKLKLTNLAKGVKILSETDALNLLERLGVKDAYLQVDGLSSEMKTIKEKAIADGTFMKAPNGNKSKLNERQWLQTRTQRFKEWFGDWEKNPENASKVVDENGEPLVVYHGTSKNFNTFDTTKQTTTAHGYGFYFTNDINIAKGYNNRNQGREINAFLDLKNPIKESRTSFTDKELYNIISEAVRLEIEKYKDEILDYKDSFLSNVVDTYSTSKENAIKELIDLIKNNETAVEQIAELSNIIGDKVTIQEAVKNKLGIDGIIVKDFQGTGSDVYISFLPNQIKSATENKGSFSQFNDDIRYQKELSDKGITVTPNGFVYKDVVYLVREKVKADTPIHEFGHLWNKYAKEHLPDVYKKGAELIKDTKYYKDLENNPAYKDLSEQRKIDEALAQYIGEKGARIVDASKKQKLARWFQTLFRRIGQQLGFTGRQKEIDKVKQKLQNPKTSESEKQFLRKRLEIMEKSKNKFISDLTLEEYGNYVAGELLVGEPIKENKTDSSNYVNEADISQIDVEYKRNKAIKETREKVSEQLRNKKTYAEKIKKNLKSYIDEVVKDKDISLSKSDVKKLLSLMKNSKTKRNLEKAIKDVDRIVFKAEEKAKKEKEQIQDLKEQANDKNLKEKGKLVKDTLGKGKQANERVAEMKGSELKKIVNLLSNKKTSLQEAFNIIDEIVVTADNRKLEKDIDNILNRKLVGKQSGKKKANRVAEEQVNQLVIIKENTNVKKTEIPDKLQEIEQKQAELRDKIDEIEQERFVEKDGNVEEVDLPKERQDELDTLTREHRAYDISKEHLEAQISDPHTKNERLLDVYENVKSIYETGRDVLENLKLQEKEKIENEINRVIEEIDEGNKLDTPESKLSLRQLQDKNKRIKLKELLDKYLKYGVFNLRTLFVLLSKKGKEGWDDSPLINLENRLSEKFTKKETTKRDMTTHLNDIVKNNFGSSFKADKTLNKKHLLKIKDNEVPLTTSQLLNVWMNWHNAELREGLKENGFTEKVMRQIENILPDNVKSFGKELFDFYDKYYELNNETFKKMQYVSLPKTEYYAGKVFRAGEELRQETPNLMDMVRFGTTAHGSLKSRTKNNKPIDAVDVIFLAKKYIDETAHYNAFAEIHREYSKLFGDKRVQKAIELNNPGKSKTYLDVIDWYKKMYMENGGDRGIRAIQAIAKNVIQAQLQFKTKIGLTQTASFINGLAEMPKGTTPLEYFKSFASIPKHLDYIMKDDYIKNRYGLEGFTDAMSGLNQIVSSSKYTQNETVDAYINQFNKYYSKLKDIGMSPVKAGDFFGIIGTIPVYDAYYRKYRKQYNEQTARKKALERWRSVADRTQQSISPFRKSYLQHHPFMRYFMMFQTAPIQNFNNAYMHYNELKRSIQGKEYKGSNIQNAYGMMNYQILQPLIYTWFAQALAGSMNNVLGTTDTAPNDLDKNLFSSVIVGNAKSLPIAGQLLQNAVDIALEKEKIYGLGIPSPIQDSYKKMTNSLKYAYTSQSEKSRRKHIKNAFIKGAGILTGTSEFALDAMVNDWNKIYQNDEVANEVKFLRGLGYSLNVIEQIMAKRKTRTQAEKERIKKYIKALKRDAKKKNTTPPEFRKYKNG